MLTLDDITIFLKQPHCDIKEGARYLVVPECVNVPCDSCHLLKFYAATQSVSCSSMLSNFAGESNHTCETILDFVHTTNPEILI